MKLSKIEKYYINGNIETLTEAEIAKDLGRKLPDSSLSRYIKSLQTTPKEAVVPEGVTESSTFKMFVNTKKGSVSMSKGASEIGDETRIKNEKKLPPYVRRI